MTMTLARRAWTLLTTAALLASCSRATPPGENGTWPERIRQVARPAPVTASSCAPASFSAAARTVDTTLRSPVLLETDQTIAGNLLAPYAAMRDLESAYMAHPVWSQVYPEIRLNYEQFLGFPCAGLQALSLPGLRQEYASTDTARIASEYRPVDALEHIVSKAGGTRFVIWGEEHHLPQTRSVYESLLRRLRTLGYGYLATEAFADPLQDGLETPDATMGYYVRDPVYASAVRVAIELGYQLVAYDDPGAAEAAGTPRDEYQARRIVEQTIGRDSTARVLILAGRSHAAEATGTGWEPMALVLRRLTGIDPLTLYAPTMTERLRPDQEHPLYRDATRRGLVDGPTIFVSRDSGEALGSSAFDAYVFWPRVRFEAGRPDWMATTLERVPVELPDELLTGTGPLLVQAHRPDDPASAIPLDQVLVTDPASAPRLVLPAGEIRLRTINHRGEEERFVTLDMPRSAALDAVAAELVVMGEEDQSVRDAEGIEAMGPEERRAFFERVEESGRRHVARLREIVAAHGWPDRRRFGPDAARAAFLLIQHADSDLEFQGRMLPLLEAAARIGTIASVDFAYLTDRVRAGQGRAQVYGTQYRVVTNAAGAAVADSAGRLQYLPPVVVDRARLDARRAEAGLGPWIEYERHMAEVQEREVFTQPLEAPGS